MLPNVRLVAEPELVMLVTLAAFVRSSVDAPFELVTLITSMLVRAAGDTDTPLSSTFSVSVPLPPLIASRLFSVAVLLDREALNVSSPAPPVNAVPLLTPVVSDQVNTISIYMILIDN
jgi:hypothetical protein